MAARRKASVSARQSRNQFPEKIVIESGERRIAFTKKHGFRASHKALASDGELALGDSVIVKGDPSSDERPVYQIEPSGIPAIPTGRVFLRFAEHIDAASRQKEIASAGYRIVKKLPYAPHTAWVEPKNGSVADALSHLDGLKALRDIENVEPQMLMERGKRS